MIESNISLKKYNTFGLDVKAKNFFSFTEISELESFLETHQIDLKEIVILGGGSNVLFSKDFEGWVIHPNLKSIEKIKETKDEIFFEVGAGLNWDDFVQFCVKNRYYGAENMSLIPGSVGATAVQNAGAYGTEAKDMIVEVITYDLADRKILRLSNSDCKFEYRNSIFKTETYRNRILITSIVYKLSKISKYRHKLNSYQGNLLKKHYSYWKDFLIHLAKSLKLRGNKGKSILDYRFLKNLLEDSGLLPLWLKRKIVIRTRTSKLPDINKLGNVGSFFKNPIIPKSKAEILRSEYPDIILFPYLESEMKVSAAWLIDKCGWSGKRIGDAGSLKHLPLTLVNYGNAKSCDILELSKQIEAAVLDKFDVVLEKEVVII